MERTADGGRWRGSNRTAPASSGQSCGLLRRKKTSCARAHRARDIRSLSRSRDRRRRCATAPGATSPAREIGISLSLFGLDVEAVRLVRLPVGFDIEPQAVPTRYPARGVIDDGDCGEAARLEENCE